MIMRALRMRRSIGVSLGTPVAGVVTDGLVPDMAVSVGAHRGTMLGPMAAVLVLASVLRAISLAVAVGAMAWTCFLVSVASPSVLVTLPMPMAVGAMIATVLVAVSAVRRSAVR